MSLDMHIGYKGLDVSKAGVDVSDADALVTDVKATKTFYSVATPRKTGTLPTKAIVAANDNYEEGYHAGNPGGLAAIDTHLAPANIAKDVDVFGFTGTHKELIDYAVNAPGTWFRRWAAVGNFTAFPERINDNDFAERCYAQVINQYAEATFGDLVKIQRWRQYGEGDNDINGEWKIQYYDVETNTWVDWVTGIPTRKPQSWSDYVSEAVVVTTKIRLVCTVVDTGSGTNRSYIRELEVIY